MRIGLDFDGVISDAGKLKSDGALRLYGLDIPPEKFKRELVVGEGHLTEEQYSELQRIIYGTEEVGFLMELVEEFKLHLDKLLEDGHTVIVITSRTEESLEVARKWARMQDLHLEFVGTGKDLSKAAAASRAGCNVFVDDDLDKLEPLAGAVPYLFHFGWGYNEHIDASHVALRVNSWKELYEQIAMIG